MFPSIVVANIVNFSVSNLNDIYPFICLNKNWKNLIEETCESTWIRLYTEANFIEAAKYKNILFLNRFVFSEIECDKLTPLKIYQAAFKNRNINFINKLMEIEQTKIPILLIAMLAALYECEEILLPLLDENKISINDTIDKVKEHAYFYGKIPYGIRKLCKDENYTKFLQGRKDFNEDKYNTYLKDENIINVENFINMKLYHIVIYTKNINLVERILRYKPEFCNSSIDELWMSCLDHALCKSNHNYGFEILRHMYTAGTMRYEFLINSDISGIDELAFWQRVKITFHNLWIDYHDKYPCQRCYKFPGSDTCCFVRTKKIEHDQYSYLDVDKFIVYFEKLINILEVDHIEVARIAQYFGVQEIIRKYSLV